MKYIFLFDNKPMELNYFGSRANDLDITFPLDNRDTAIGLVYDDDSNILSLLQEGQKSSEKIAENIITFVEFDNILSKKNSDSKISKELVEDINDKKFIENLKSLKDLEDSITSQIKDLEKIEKLDEKLTREGFSDYDKELMGIEFYGILLGEEHKDEIKVMKETAKAGKDLKEKFKESKNVDDMIETMKEVTKIIRQKKEKEQLTIKAATNFGNLMQVLTLGTPSDEDKLKLEEITQKLKHWGIAWTEKATGEKIEISNDLAIMLLTSKLLAILS